jgi:hypothetical protein
MAFSESASRNLIISLAPNPVNEILDFYVSQNERPPRPFAPASRRRELLLLASGSIETRPPKSKAVSNIDAACPQLRREFHRLRADLRSRTGRPLALIREWGGCGLPQSSLRSESQIVVRHAHPPKNSKGRFQISDLQFEICHLRSRAMSARAWVANIIGAEVNTSVTREAVK